VVEEGPCDALLSTPRHPYTEALLAAVPQVHERRSSLVSIPGHPPSRVTATAGCPFEPRCARAVPRCAEMPELVAEGSGRRLACWRPVAEPARVEAVREPTS
jgi:oligopeptide/dipeptide ABC transporter ATP-binding protein